MAKKSPTQRSLAWCRSRGWTVAVVERWNQFAKVRQDLYGFIDLVAMDEDAVRIVAIQATAAGVSARLAKIEAEPRVRTWLRCGGYIEVHGWTLRGAKSKRKTYQLRRVRVWLDGEALMTEEIE